MNRREAIAYAQITLEYMQSSKYNGKLNPETLGLEMKQAFKLYPCNIVLNIADSQIQTLKEIQTIANRCDTKEYYDK